MPGIPRVSAAFRPAAVAVPDSLRQLDELLLGRKLKELLLNALPLDVLYGIVVARASFNGDVENQPNRANSVVEIGRSGCLTETRRPSQTIRFGDPGDIRVAQLWPGFQESRDAFLPVSLAALFERVIAVKSVPVGLE